MKTKCEILKGELIANKGVIGGLKGTIQGHSTVRFGQYLFGSPKIS